MNNKAPNQFPPNPYPPGSNVNYYGSYAAYQPQQPQYPGQFVPQQPQPGGNYSILNYQQQNQYGANLNQGSNRYNVTQQWTNANTPNNGPQGNKFQMQMKARSPKRIITNNLPKPTPAQDTSSFPPKLVKYVQECFSEFGKATGHLPQATQQQMRTLVHTQLKEKIQKSRDDGNMYSLDWTKTPKPAYLQELITRKRKRDSEMAQNKRRKRGPSPTSLGNAFYTKQRLQESSSEDEWTLPSKGKGKKKKGKNKKNKKASKWMKNVDDQADEWFAMDDTALSSARAARRSKRFGISRPKAFDWRMPDIQVQKSADFESAKITGNNTTVLKDFFRLTREARPGEIRTKKTCAKALNLIVKKWNSEHDYRWCENQLKSLRQDLKVQHIRDKLAVRTYETHARICLEVSDLSEYNQCQTALRSLYLESEGNRSNELEFVMYRVLYLAAIDDQAGLLKVINQMQKTTDSNVRTAVKISLSIKTGNYVQVFALYKKLPKLAKNLVDQIKEKIRYKALCIICSSFCPQPYPVAKIQTVLGFNSLGQARSYLRQCGIKLKDSSKIDTVKSKGKVVEYVAKNRDNEHGITHGSLGVQQGDKQQDADSISHFLKKYH